MSKFKVLTVAVVMSVAAGGGAVGWSARSQGLPVGPPGRAAPAVPGAKAPELTDRDKAILRLRQEIEDILKSLDEYAKPRAGDDLSVLKRQRLATAIQNYRYNTEILRAGSIVSSYGEILMSSERMFVAALSLEPAPNRRVVLAENRVTVARECYRQCELRTNAGRETVASYTRVKYQLEDAEVKLLEEKQAAAK